MGNNLDSSNPNYEGAYKKQGFDIPDDNYYTCKFEK